MLGLTAVGPLASALSSALIIQTVPFEVAQESLAAAVLLTVSLVAAVGLGLDRVVNAAEPLEHVPTTRRTWIPEDDEIEPGSRAADPSSKGSTAD